MKIGPGGGGAGGVWGEFFFTGSEDAAGRPVVFGRVPERGDGSKGRYSLGCRGIRLTQVTFHCFVEPMLRALGGASGVGPRFGAGLLGGGCSAGKGGLRGFSAGFIEVREG